MTSPGDRGGTLAIAASLLRRTLDGEVASPARLRILDGPLAGRRLPLGSEETLGRGPAATIRLADPAASRLHLRLRAAGGVATAQDLGSKNGALVNGRGLGRRPRRLRPGDVLSLGATRLALELDGPIDRAGASRPIRGGIPAAGALLLAAAAALLLALLP